MRKVALGSGIAVLGLVLVFLAGPRSRIDVQLAFPDLPEDLEGYLARSEARFPDLVPGAEKTIVWAGTAGARTPLALVYLHGYSAWISSPGCGRDLPVKSSKPPAPCAL